MKNQYSSQRGFVLLTALIFMIVLTMLAMTAVRRATQDERFTNSIRAQNVAFQAAETALRYCQKEFEITNRGDALLPGTVATVNGVPVNLAVQVTPGQYLPPVLWKTISNWATKGKVLSSTLVTNTASPPQCMIEEWYRPKDDSTGSGLTTNRNAGSNSAGNQKAYVITARGTGISVASEIWLQVIIYLGAGTTK
ncbi:pilus assembly PilX family protein [Undibacterium sp. Di27W]|uniref:pilus assembly PilX family protein n=1 Tax=Undibacterium sp. Di27W TaxID=3413036 RepID=UPI003BF37607